jgi:ribosomal protein S27AE
LVETQGAVIRSGLSREEAEDLVAEFDGVYLAFVASGEIKGRDKPACPRCGSQSIQVVRKGGFDFGKAAFGAAMFGPFGSSAGLVGSNDMMRVCANCGYKF